MMRAIRPTHRLTSKTAMHRWTWLCAAALLRVPMARSFCSLSRSTSCRIPFSAQPEATPTLPHSLRLSRRLGNPSNDEEYFIRDAAIADMGEAARILAEGFYGDRDFFAKAYERFRTYLSLESDFPKQRDQHRLLVACRSRDGQVIAMCDVDNRIKQEPRPYMCNLAVDPTWRNRGLAKALILESERLLQNQWFLSEAYLKVKEKNEAAVSLYNNLGYLVESQSVDPKSGDVLLTMRKDLSMQTETVPAKAISREKPAWAKNGTLLLE